MSLRFRPILLISGFVFCLSMATFQYSLGNELFPFPSQAAVPSISVHDLQAQVKKKKLLLLDVRQSEEFNQGHIKGAVSMPLDIVPDRYKELPKKKQIVVYCRSGKRSAQAVSFLQTHGYTNTISLSGGYQEWSTLQQQPKAKERTVCSTSTGCKKGG